MLRNLTVPTFVFLLKFPDLSIFLLDSQHQCRPWSVSRHLVQLLNFLLVLGAEQSSVLIPHKTSLFVCRLILFISMEAARFVHYIYIYIYIRCRIWLYSILSVIQGTQIAIFFPSQSSVCWKSLRPYRPISLEVRREVLLKNLLTSHDKMGLKVFTTFGS